MSAHARDHRLDLVKGVLIVGVVVGHFLEVSGGAPATALSSGWSVEPQRTVLTFLYLFHMPLFVLLAGITARRRTMTHRIVQMLVLYLIFQVAYLLFQGQPVTPDTLVHPVYALWFLLAMAWWIASLPLIGRLGAAALPVAVGVAVVAVLAPVEDGSLLTWSRAACFWPFFVAGHLYGPTVLRRTAGLPLPSGVVAVGVLVATTSVVIGSGLLPQWFRGADGAASMGESAVVAVVVRVLCLGAAVVCAWAVLVLVPDRLPAAETMGRRSLAIYVLHIPLVLTAQDVFERAGLGALVAAVVALGVAAVTVTVLTLPIFDRALRSIATTVADAVVPTVSPAGTARG